MTLDTATAVPRLPQLDRDVAMRLAAQEYTHFHAQLQQLDPDDWSRPTECPGWDVRAMAGHVLGMARMAASVPQAVHQMRAAKRRGGVMVDALTAVQVEEQAHLGVDDLVARFGRIGPKAAKGRRRAPGFVRSRPMPEEQQVGDAREVWTSGFLLDVILTRDPWMHRIDIARATDRALVLTPDHDGVIVADVVAEWLSRLGKSVALTLTGPAGRTWSGPGQLREVDAIEFCRALSGRAAAPEAVEATEGVVVPF